MELVVIGRGLSGWDDACGQPGFVFNVDRGGGLRTPLSKSLPYERKGHYYGGEEGTQGA